MNVSVLKIFCYPEAVLKRKTEKVVNFDSELKQLSEDMLETMFSASGIGLAAPQVGVSKSLIVVDLCEDSRRGQTLVMVNPEIIESEGSSVMEEGCLSLPGVNADIRRSEKIKVAFQDISGVKAFAEYDGMSARIVQHEVDHLDGVLLVDKIGKLKSDFYKRKLKRLYKKTNG